ncbi:MAG TPA: hypothetical protein VEF06_01975 [Bryobacteraceae bacterium]|nr:hypothetical protein [Bryobacteraceae bacterium]
MIQPQSLRFFLPMQNPFGFGVLDFIIFGVALLLVAGLVWRRQIGTLAIRVAGRRGLSVAICALMPIALRLLLLPGHPIPTPRVADDFSYLLAGDTLAHFRLANPAHPMHRFFEGVFVLQEPEYASNFPMGQGIVLAIGEWLGNPWFGVLLSAGAMCGLVCWMLQAWVSPVWALTGGLLAGIEFGPLSSWMNTYWGGAVSGIAGCLVFGALPRLGVRRRYAVLLGAGLGLQMLSRPYESVLLLIAAAIFPISRRNMAIALLAMLPAAGLTLLQNRAVTGSWLELPYTLSRHQYGIPTAFRFQKAPVPHKALTIEQQVDYETQVKTHDRPARFGERIPFLRFFLLPPLWLALPFCLRSLREPRFLRALAAIAILWIGAEAYPYFYPHYIAAVACLFVLIGVKALESLGRFRVEAMQFVLLLCLAHFCFWYGIHLAGGQNVELAASRYESWDELNTGDPEGRIAINKRLAAAPGKQLVFVRYFPQHGAMEWIHNAADIDGAKVVWALDLGAEEDAKLRSYYPGRNVWLLEPDAHPPVLVPQP